MAGPSGPPRLYLLGFRLGKSSLVVALPGMMRESVVFYRRFLLALILAMWSMNALFTKEPGRALLPVVLAPWGSREVPEISVGERSIRSETGTHHSTFLTTGCIGVSIDKGTVCGHMVHLKSLVASRYRIRAPQRQRARPLSSNVSMFDMVGLLDGCVYIVIDG